MGSDINSKHVQGIICVLIDNSGFNASSGEVRLDERFQSVIHDGAIDRSGIATPQKRINAKTGFRVLSIAYQLADHNGTFSRERSPGKSEFRALSTLERLADQYRSIQGRTSESSL